MLLISISLRLPQASNMSWFAAGWCVQIWILLWMYGGLHRQCWGQEWEWRKIIITACFLRIHQCTLHYYIRKEQGGHTRIACSTSKEHPHCKFTLTHVFFLCLCFQIINNTCSIREAHLLKPSSGKFSPSRLFFVCYRIQFTSHDKSPGPSPYLSIGLDFPFPKAFHGLFVTTSVSLTCRLECPTATSALSHKKDLSIQGVVSGILLTFHTYYPGVGELHFRKQRRQKIQNATPAFHSEVYQGEPWYAWEPGSGGSPWHLSLQVLQPFLEANMFPCPFGQTHDDQRQAVDKNNQELRLLDEYSVLWPNLRESWGLMSWSLRNFVVPTKSECILRCISCFEKVDLHDFSNWKQDMLLLLVLVLLLLLLLLLLLIWFWFLLLFLFVFLFFLFSLLLFLQCTYVMYVDGCRWSIFR